MSFICGLSSIRYILQFQLPLAAVLCSYALAQFFKEKQTFNFRKFFIENVPVFFSCAGLVLGAIGYVVNSTVLARLFSFSDFNRIRFSTIGDVSFTRLFSDIAMIFGYKNRVSVMTPAGIVNVLFYVSLVFFIVSTVSFLKKKEMSVQKVFITFTVVMFLFNGFVYINTEYTPRYFIILFACIPVCLAVYAAEKDFSAVKRYISLISFSCMCLISCVITFEDVMTKDPATDKKDVAEFLEKSPYTFGYATFWNANVFSYLTNGKMEIAVLKRTEKDENVHITKTFNCQQWLTPDRFYNRKENTSPVCLIVTENEYTTTPDHPLFAKGRLVYKDNFYRVFEFESDVAFKESF
ncbi:MAG: hypothetical protein PUI24_05990 [Spirochaetales bacterium]|nr:hypothetical protein [Spirochaetales bacterium]